MESGWEQELHKHYALKFEPCFFENYKNGYRANISRVARYKNLQAYYYKLCTEMDHEIELLS